MQDQRRYNARYNSTAYMSAMCAMMKLIGALESIDEMYADGEGIDADAIQHLEERVAVVADSIIKIWSYPLDNEREIGGD